MRTIRITCSTLLGAVLLVGCTEQNVPTASTDALPTPAFNFLNGPAAPGPIIVRFQDQFVTFYSDFDRGLTAIHGVDIVALCAGDPFFFELVDIQDVTNPTEAAAVNELFQGDDLTTSVWAFTLVGFSCAPFVATIPLATGTADLTSTDNDFFAFLRDEPARANAFGFTAQGRLNLTSGGTAHFNGEFRAVFKPGESFRAVSKINLR